MLGRDCIIERFRLPEPLDGFEWRFCYGSGFDGVMDPGRSVEADHFLDAVLGHEAFPAIGADTMAGILVMPLMTGRRDAAATCTDEVHRFWGKSPRSGCKPAVSGNRRPLFPKFPRTGESVLVSVRLALQSQLKRLLQICNKIVAFEF